MRVTIVFLLFFLSFTAFTHEGHFLAIQNVQVSAQEDYHIIAFDLINERNVELTDLKIDLLIDGEITRWQKVKKIEANQPSVRLQFKVYEEQFNPHLDIFQIEVVKLFGLKGDYAGYDSPIPDGYGNRQKNELGTSSVIADAPWRMKKLDENGNINPIPIHVFIHDADVLLADVRINWIDIKVKDAGLTSFGAPLTYNTYLDAAYKSLFSCLSQTDAHMDIQEFDLNKLAKSATHTIDFNNQDPLIGDDFTKFTSKFAYFTFNIPPQDLVLFNGDVDVEVAMRVRKGTNVTYNTRVYRMRIFRENEDLPKQKGYYRGDTHLHSIYTQNSAETGLPLCATKEAGELIGLDWITTTDHTSDIDNFGTTITNNWRHILNDIKAQNSAGGTLKYIPGQEVALNNTNGDLVHMLAYPSYKNPQNFPYLGDGKGDVTRTNVSVNSALYALTTFGGFSYAAHPFATADKLPTVPVGGGIWNLNDPTFTANGNNFPLTGGNIICNDLSKPTDVFSPKPNVFIKDALKGGQIWNERDALETGGDDRDPWDVTNSSSQEFEAVDTADVDRSFILQFRQGQEIINHINKRGLYWKNQNPNYTNWKFYYLAGSDAHGSFNNSNTNDFASLGNITDNAVGKASTLVYCPNGMGENGEHVLAALEAGHFTLSGGPIVSMGVSTDGDISNNEILMGDDGVVNVNLFKNYHLNVNYTSTQEFGDVKSLRLIVGTENGEVGKTIPVTNLNGDNMLTYKLNEIIDSVATAGSIEEDKYFYVRAELNTEKTGLDPAVYRMNFGTYWSFSNPIWLKYKDVPLPTEFDIVAYPNPTTSDLNLKIQNPEPADLTLQIYDRSGRLVYNAVKSIVEYDVVTISGNTLNWAQGVYMVKATIGDNEKLIKVVKE